MTMKTAAAGAALALAAAGLFASMSPKYLLKTPRCIATV